MNGPVILPRAVSPPSIDHLFYSLFLLLPFSDNPSLDQTIILFPGLLYHVAVVSNYSPLSGNILASTVAFRQGIIDRLLADV